MTKQALNLSNVDFSKLDENQLREKIKNFL